MGQEWTLGNSVDGSRLDPLVALRADQGLGSPRQREGTSLSSFLRPTVGEALLSYRVRPRIQLVSRLGTSGLRVVGCNRLLQPEPSPGEADGAGEALAVLVELPEHGGRIRDTGHEDDVFAGTSTRRRSV